MKFLLSTLAVLALSSGAHAKIRRGRGRGLGNKDSDVVEIMSENGQDIKVYEDKNGNEVIEIQSVRTSNTVNAKPQGKGSSGDREDCPSSSGCQFEPSNPVKCGNNYDCFYDNQCLAFSAGYGTADCCSAPNPGGCALIWEPHVCGSKQCPYDNMCIAELAGFTSSQCTGPTPSCDDYEITISCAQSTDTSDRVDVYLRDPSRSMDLEIFTYNNGICNNSNKNLKINYNSCYDVSEVDLLTFGGDGVLVNFITLKKNGSQIDSWSTNSNNKAWCLSKDSNDHSGNVVGGDNWGDHCVDQIYYTPTGIRTGNFLPR